MQRQNSLSVSRRGRRPRLSPFAAFVLGYDEHNVNLTRLGVGVMEDKAMRRGGPSNGAPRSATPTRRSPQIGEQAGSDLFCMQEPCSFTSRSEGSFLPRKIHLHQPLGKGLIGLTQRSSLTALFFKHGELFAVRIVSDIRQAHGVEAAAQIACFQGVNAFEKVLKTQPPGLQSIQLGRIDPAGKRIEPGFTNEACPCWPWKTLWCSPPRAGWRAPQTRALLSKQVQCAARPLTRPIPANLRHHALGVG